MRLHEIEQYSLSENILKESWNYFDDSQKQQILLIESSFRPIMKEYVELLEKNLSDDQIKKLFTSIELLTKKIDQKPSLLQKIYRKSSNSLPVKMLQKIDDKVDELGKKLQNTKPIKNLDDAYDKLKNKIVAELGENHKVVASFEKIKKYLENNPGKTTVGIGVLTVAASFASGPAGAAATSAFLKSAVSLIKGDKLSTTIGKGIKSGVYGWLAGKTIQEISEIIGGFEVGNVEGMRSVDSYKVHVSRIGVPGPSYDFHVFSDDKALMLEFKSSLENMEKAVKNMDWDEARRWYQETKEWADILNGPENLDQVQKTFDDNQKLYQAAKAQVDSLNGFLDVTKKSIEAVIQGAVGAKTAKESYYNEKTQLNENVLNKVASLFRKKKNEWTAENLIHKWKKSDQPRNVNEILTFLKNVGLPDKVLELILKQKEA